MTTFYRWPHPLLVAFLLFAFGAAFPVTADADWFRSKVEKSDAKFVENFGKGDAAALARLYTEDAKLLPPGSPVIEGRAGIEEFWNGLLALGPGELTLTVIESFGDGTVGYAVGKYTLKVEPEEGDPIEDEGKYVEILKRGPTGGWEIAVDIFNTSLAPAAAEEPEEAEEEAAPEVEEEAAPEAE